MNLTYHVHLTGLDAVVVAVVEIAWWGAIVYGVHRWRRARRNKREN